MEPELIDIGVSGHAGMGNRILKVNPTGTEIFFGDRAAGLKPLDVGFRRLWGL